MSQVGPLEIPISEVLAYCELFKVHDLHDRTRIFKFVKRIDRAYLEVIAEKHKTEAKKAD